MLRSRVFGWDRFVSRLCFRFNGDIAAMPLNDGVAALFERGVLAWSATFTGVICSARWSVGELGRFEVSAARYTRGGFVSRVSVVVAVSAD